MRSGTLEQPRAQDRKSFVLTFTEVLEKVAYVNTSKFLRDLEVTVNKEKVLSGKAMVYTSIVHEKEGARGILTSSCTSGGSWVVKMSFWMGPVWHGTFDPVSEDYPGELLP